MTFPDIVFKVERVSVGGVGVYIKEFLDDCLV